jgi:hypothetical protein
MAAFLFCSVALAGNRYEARVVPDLLTHLKYAHEGIESGQWSAASAHTDAILLTPRVLIAIRFETEREDLKDLGNQAATAAFRLWERTLGYELSYVPAEDADADIVLTFQERRIGRGHGQAGYARWKRTVTLWPTGATETKLHATVEMRMLDFGGKPMNLDCLTQLTAHELGHVMGLKDSNKVGEIMGPMDLRKPVSKPSDSEVEGLLSVREEAWDIKRQAALLALANRERYNLRRASD